MTFTFFERMKNDVHLRIKTFLRLSIIFNIIYSMFLLLVGRVYSSKWFFVMFIYYGLLSIMRILVFLHLSNKKHVISKIKTMRACGYFLLVINLVVSTMMFILSYGKTLVKHHEITVITLATYTFFSLTVAIVGSTKYLKQNDYVYSSSKLISLISASVSLVTLTNAMLITFGEDGLLLRKVILPLLCGAVAIFIISCAMFMIKKANLDLKVIKDEKERK